MDYLETRSKNCNYYGDCHYCTSIWDDFTLRLGNIDLNNESQIKYKIQ